jgi:hypothetical protein
MRMGGNYCRIEFMVEGFILLQKYKAEKVECLNLLYSRWIIIKSTLHGQSNKEIDQHFSKRHEGAMYIISISFGWERI